MDVVSELEGGSQGCVVQGLRLGWAESLQILRDIDSSVGQIKLRINRGAARQKEEY